MLALDAFCQNADVQDVAKANLKSEMYFLARCKVRDICENLRCDNEQSRCDTSESGSL